MSLFNPFQNSQIELDDHLVLILKKFSKKDSITRIKAMNELLDNLNSNHSPFIDKFLLIFRKTICDSDPRLRSLSQQLIKVLFDMNSNVVLEDHVAMIWLVGSQWDPHENTISRSLIKKWHKSIIIRNHLVDMYEHLEGYEGDPDIKLTFIIYAMIYAFKRENSIIKVDNKLFHAGTVPLVKVALYNYYMLFDEIDKHVFNISIQERSLTNLSIPLILKAYDRLKISELEPLLRDCGLWHKDSLCYIKDLYNKIDNKERFLDIFWQSLRINDRSKLETILSILISIDNTRINILVDSYPDLAIKLLNDDQIKKYFFDNKESKSISESVIIATMDKMSLDDKRKAILEEYPCSDNLLKIIFDKHYEKSDYWKDLFWNKIKISSEQDSHSLEFFEYIMSKLKNSSDKKRLLNAIPTTDSQLSFVVRTGFYDHDLNIDDIEDLDYLKEYFVHNCERKNLSSLLPQILDDELLKRNDQNIKFTLLYSQIILDYIESNHPIEGLSERVFDFLGHDNVREIIVRRIQDKPSLYPIYKKYEIPRLNDDLLKSDNFIIQTHVLKEKVEDLPFLMIQLMKYERKSYLNDASLDLVPRGNLIAFINEIIVKRYSIATISDQVVRYLFDHSVKKENENENGTDNYSYKNNNDNDNDSQRVSNIIYDIISSFYKNENDKNDDRDRDQALLLFLKSIDVRFKELPPVTAMNWDKLPIMAIVIEQFPQMMETINIPEDNKAKIKILSESRGIGHEESYQMDISTKDYSLRCLLSSLPLSSINEDEKKNGNEKEEKNGNEKELNNNEIIDLFEWKSWLQVSLDDEKRKSYMIKDYIEWAGEIPSDNLSVIKSDILKIYNHLIVENIFYEEMDEEMENKISMIFFSSQVDSIMITMRSVLTCLVDKLLLRLKGRKELNLWIGLEMSLREPSSSLKLLLSLDVFMTIWEGSGQDFSLVSDYWESNMRDRIISILIANLTGLENVEFTEISSFDNEMLFRANLLYRLLKITPGGLRDHVPASLIQKYYSPVLIEREIGRIKRHAHDRIRIKRSSTETLLEPRYDLDGQSMSLVIKISNDFPAHPPLIIEDYQNINIDQGKWRKWLLHLSNNLRLRINILDSILNWKENISKSLGGLEPCPICYAIVTDKSIPSVKCKRCPYMYHSSCMYKWLKKSPTCPICRNEFNTS